MSGDANPTMATVFHVGWQPNSCWFLPCVFLPWSLTNLPRSPQSSQILPLIQCDRKWKSFHSLLAEFLLNFLNESRVEGGGAVVSGHEPPVRPTNSSSCPERGGHMQHAASSYVICISKAKPLTGRSEPDSVSWPIVLRLEWRGHFTKLSMKVKLSP
jgi:hypothetical protein